MNYSIVAKLLFSSIIDAIGLLNLKFKTIANSNFVILMYHRIVPRNTLEISIQDGMYVDPHTFDIHLGFLNKHFNVVSIAEMFSAINSGKLIDTNKPLCALTFDDGWSDFYDYAFPLIHKHNTPATVYLPTDFIGSDTWFWTDRLSYILGNLPKRKSQSLSFSKSTNPIIKIILDSDDNFYSQLENSIDLLKTFHPDKIKQIILELSEFFKIAEPAQYGAFLSWEKIHAMFNSGLVSFGSHTMSHRILTNLYENEINNELIGSKEVLIGRHVVDPNFISFCYPNGNFNRRIAQLVKQAGYQIAITTQKGLNTLDTNPYALNRIGVHQDMASTASMLGCRILNII